MLSNKTRDTAPIQSLDRGLAILKAVAVSPVPVPLKQLTDLIGIDRSSVCRLANTLRRRRFLANPIGSKDYILGPTAWRLSRKYGRTPIGTFFHEHLRALTSRIGETSHIAVREGVQAFFVDHHAPSNHVVTVAGQTGEFVPLHCTAHGKALLSDMNLDALTALLGPRRSRPLRGTRSSRCRSSPDLRQVRTAGYALDDREHLADVRCIAVPIRDGQGEIIASVGISAPLTRLPQSRILKATAEVVAAARAISASLEG